MYCVHISVCVEVVKSKDWRLLRRLQRCSGAREGARSLSRYDSAFLPPLPAWMLWVCVLPSLHGRA
ncbi:hypothetical protein M758_4G227700 [Ceratodon purpureus]|nr:hypothetical protein M758_4G227700 [Ceratodon purpureus]